MDKGGLEYSELYQEKKVIGKGNFGSATLVTRKDDPDKLQIAKKINLGNMEEKDRISAENEAKLLKELKHPHIVEYIENYIEDDTFIIIMEYCEEGDLSYHVKRMRQKKEHFSEDLILNWFLQIAFALNFIHSKKILHRDIKSSNIFLSSNGIVKIGDFGISKVQEGTLEKAETIVGTPYYMSPEVCENVPYSYKSDVWALGCVLYELCTLKHAFSANNLLGLVYKIVQEKQEPIPSIYSKSMIDLCAKLLIKNYRSRPNIDEIIQMPFIRQVACKFIERRGVVEVFFLLLKIQEHIPIKKTAYHRDKTITDKNSNDPITMSMNQGSQHTDMLLTPAQRLKKKKEEEARRREAELVNATRQQYVNAHGVILSPIKKTGQPTEKT